MGHRGTGWGTDSGWLPGFTAHVAEPAVPREGSERSAPCVRLGVQGCWRHADGAQWPSAPVGASPGPQGCARWQTVGTSRPPLLGVEVGQGRPGKAWGKGQAPRFPPPPLVCWAKTDYEAWPVAGATWRLGQHGQPGQRGAKAGWLRRGCIRVRSAGLCGQEQCSLCPRGQPGRWDKGW